MCFISLFTGLLLSAVWAYVNSMAVAAYKMILESKEKYFWIDPSLLEKTDTGRGTHYVSKTSQ